MIMQARVVKREASVVKHRTYQCTHVQVTSVEQRINLPEEEDVPAISVEPGIYVEVCGVPGQGTIYINLPEDGDEFYLMNDKGVTTQAYYWPIRKKAPETDVVNDGGEWISQSPPTDKISTY